MMITNQAGHRSIQQQFRVLKNLCSELSLSRLTMTTKERRGGGGVLLIHQPCDRGEGGSGQSMQTHNRFQLGFTPPSEPFM
jgi:hypothetical protein